MARPPKPKADLTGIQIKKDDAGNVISYKVDFIKLLPNGNRFRRGTNVKAIGNPKALEEAIAFRDQAKADYKNATEGIQTLANEGYTIQTWSEHCMHNILPSQANKRGKLYEPATIEGYASLLKKFIYPKIGSVKLTKLTVEQVDSLIASVPTPNTKRNTKNILSIMLSLAEKRNHRPRNSNPCFAVKLPSTRKARTKSKVIVTETVKDASGRKEREFTPVPDGLLIEDVRWLSFEEEDALLEYVRNDPDHKELETLLLLGLRLGLRIGEALGLDWSAVDFEANTVTIDQQAQRHTGVGIVAKNVKSEAGNRTIPMPKSLAAYLKAANERAFSPHVICNTDGKRRDSSRLHNRLKKIMLGAGLNDKVVARRFVPRPTYHDLRRTCLTRLATGHVARGVIVQPVPPTVLIKISGHEDVKTLLSFYVNADESMVVGAMASVP